MKNLLNFLKNKKIIKIFFALSFVLFYSQTFATLAKWVDSASTDVSSAYDTVNLLISLITFILALWTNIVWLFLSEDWTTWAFIFWSTDSLKDVWMIFSNITYILFAFLLVYIAVMNIVWSQNQSVQLKQAVPRFIVWILIVPFTWFFVHFMITLSVFLTSAIINIPADIKWLDLDNTKIEVCTKWYEYVLSENASEGSIIAWTKKSKYSIVCKEGKPEEVNVEDYFKDNPYWIIWYYTYSVMELKQLDEVAAKENQWDNPELIQTLFDTAFHLGFDFIFIIAYALIMLALMFALLTRWMYLWLFAAVSPTLGLLYFFKKSTTWAGGGKMKNFNLKWFLSLVMVPVLVSWALTFWFILIQSIDITWRESNNWNCITLWSWEATTLCINTWEKEAQNKIDSAKEGINIFNKVIGKIFWLVVMRMWVMAALKSSEITGWVVQPIADFGTNIWKLIWDLPKYTPIIPTPSWAIWTKWLADLSNKISGIPEQLHTKRMQPLKKQIDNITWMVWLDSETMIAMKQMYDNWINSKEDFLRFRNELLNWLEKHGSSNRDVSQLLERFKWAKLSKEVQSFIYDTSWVKSEEWKIDEKHMYRAITWDRDLNEKSFGSDAYYWGKINSSDYKDNYKWSTINIGSVEIASSSKDLSVLNNNEKESIVKELVDSLGIEKEKLTKKDIESYLSDDFLNKEELAEKILEYIKKEVKKTTKTWIEE